jgi:hypothetical protein
MYYARAQALTSTHYVAGMKRGGVADSVVQTWDCRVLTQKKDPGKTGASVREEALQA